MVRGTSVNAPVALGTVVVVVVGGVGSPLPGDEVGVITVPAVLDHMARYVAQLAPRAITVTGVVIVVATSMAVEVATTTAIGVVVVVATVLLKPCPP